MPSKDVGGSAIVNWSYSVNKVVRTGLNGQGMVVKISGTEPQVLQYLADNCIAKGQLLNIANDNTWAVYFVKV